MIIGKNNDITFKVNVMGTSGEPSVRVILCTKPELAFPASKQGDSWGASIDIPSNVEPGTYDMKIEVIVNNRHFVPLTKSIEVYGSESVAVPLVQGEPAEKHSDASGKFFTIGELKTKGAEALKVAAEVPEEAAPKKPVTLPPDFFKFDSKKVDAGKSVKVKYVPIIKKEELASIEKTVSTKPPVKQKIVEIKHKLPIMLTKGELVYE